MIVGGVDGQPRILALSQEEETTAAIPKLKSRTH